MTRLCIDIAFQVRATEVISDRIEAGNFEIPPAIIEEVKRSVWSMITDDNQNVDCDIQCKIYRSEVTRLNDANKAQ